MKPSKENLQELRQFLGGNWYDRPENDETIIDEIIRDLDKNELLRCLDSGNEFLHSGRSEESMAKLIRDSVWRSFPTDEDCLNWLRRVLKVIEERLPSNKAEDQNES